MKWQSHLIIAKWVGSELGFGKENLLKLAEGSIAPDKWRNHSEHHNPKYLNERIKERILKARKYFLNNKEKYLFEIGVALHYIADRLVPEVSYPVHIDIEEEIAKMSEYKKESKSKSHKHRQEIREVIQDLKMGDEEKTLLLDPTWTKGRSNTSKLALTDLPKLFDPHLLFHIACRISIGVTASIMSRDPPPQLLWEKFKYASHSISRAITKFKFYFILEIVLPLLFLAYGRIGILCYLLIILLNLFSLIPISSILRKTTTVKNYLRLRTNSKTLFSFFLLVGLSTFIVGIVNFKLLFAAGGSVLIALLHLCYTKICVPEEVVEEIDWYNWEDI